MKHINSRLFLLTLFSVFLVSGCATKERDTVADGTSVKTKSDVFIKAAQGIEPACPYIQQLGCSCSINGIGVPCTIVFGCLQNGLCEPAN